MKNLSIEKFKISELKNKSSIYGGDTNRQNDGGTQTGNDSPVEKCVMTSVVIIEKPKDVKED